MDLIDFTERAASDPLDTAEPLPRLPPGELEVRSGRDSVGIERAPSAESCDLVDRKGPGPDSPSDADEEIWKSSKASSSPIAESSKSV